jgi:hypothetical protein
MVCGLASTLKCKKVTTQVVPKTSAVVPCATGAEPIVVHADHINVTKFASKEDRAASIHVHAGPLVSVPDITPVASLSECLGSGSVTPSGGP